MRGPSEDAKRAADHFIYDELDYALEVYEDPDYVEVIGKIGGDVIRRRFYNDGLIADK